MSFITADDELQTWDLEIKPRNNLFNLHLSDVWAYRDLLLLLVRRDFVATYKQTVLGPLWFFIQPILTTIMFAFIFGRLAGISTDNIPPVLFYLAGITSWNYFADCLTKTSNVFKDNANVFGKVYFPRLIMPLSIVVSNLVRFAIQFFLFLLAMIFYSFKGANFHSTWAVVLFPYVVILMAILGLGAGMIISAMTTKYRDLAFLITFGIQLLMYATTVIYPLSSISPKYKWLIQLNPMTSIIEIFRYGFLGKGSFTWASLAYSSAIGVILLFTGIVIFNRVEKNFVDTV